MNQIQKHPHSHILRDRSDQLLQALEALPAPQTIDDILRHTRAVIALDRLLTQLWKAPATRAQTASKAEAAPAESPTDDVEAVPLNRQQRRAQAAQDRTARDRTVKPPSYASQSLPLQASG